MNIGQKSALWSISCNVSHWQVLINFIFLSCRAPGLLTAPLSLVLPWNSPGMVPTKGARRSPTTGPSILAIDPAVHMLAKGYQVQAGEQDLKIQC